MRTIAVGLVVASGLALVAAECPNACSGHGSCGAFDMCTCYDGFMANDCSQRICPFGIAHVDSPVGDLDMDGTISFASKINQMYPNGASELFPLMVDTAGNTIAGSAHYYMECSNKGTCDRASGACSCFIGYEGSSCQRASCPNDCSGNGVCLTNRERAFKDSGNIYELWDADVGLSCDCDPGYYDYDCSKRECPYGIDPLYVDDKNTARVSTYTLLLSDTSTTPAIATSTGSFRLKFYDVFGEDWVTEPITVDNITTSGGMGCETITYALENLPNDVIPTGTVDCNGFVGGSYAAFKLAFTGNPGALKAPEPIITDRVGRDTTTDASGTTALSAYMYDTGIVGELYDYFTTDCDVSITPTNVGTGSASFGVVQTLTFGTGSTIKQLKQCLGDSDGFVEDDVDVEKWDHGTMNETMPGQYPHLVRLVKSSPTDDFDGGVYSIMFYDEVDETIKLTTTVASGTSFYVFATDGVLERVWADVNTDGVFDPTQDGLATAYWTKYDNVIYTERDYSCENAGSRGADVIFSNSTMDVFENKNCLEKGDLIVLPASTWGDHSDSADVTGATFTATTAATALTNALGRKNTAGFYEIKKISVGDFSPTTNTTEDRYQIVLDRPISWDGSDTSADIQKDLRTGTHYGIAQLFKFTPPADGGYEYAAECSARGLCDDASGLCKCFAGYTNGQCDTQSALAI